MDLLLSVFSFIENHLKKKKKKVTVSSHCDHLLVRTAERRSTRFSKLYTSCIMFSKNRYRVILLTIHKLSSYLFVRNAPTAKVSRPSVLNVDDREADYTTYGGGDLSEEKKRTADGMGHGGQRFAFGLGKRGAEWDDGGDGDGDGGAAPIWHPAVRRARLQYGFGLGKRQAGGDADDGYGAAADAEPFPFQGENDVENDDD